MNTDSGQISNFAGMSQRNKYFLIAGILLLLGFGCWYFSKIVFYILFSVFLTLLGKPIHRLIGKIRVRKKTLPGAVAALMTLLSLYIIFAGLFAIFIPLIAQEAKIISGINTQNVVNELRAPISELEDLLNRYSSDHIELGNYAQEKLSSLISAGQVTKFVNSIISFTGDIFIAFLAISFFTFFFLKDGQLIFETLILLSPKKNENDIRNVVDESKHLLIRYFSGMCIDILCVTTLISTGLYLAGVKYALIIGFFAGIMNVIPYVGPLISGLFGLLVTVSNGITDGDTVATFHSCELLILVFVIVNLLDAFLIQPFIFSKRVKAHPLEIFVVILVAGTLAGIGGMILAVPAYTVLRVIAKQFLSRFRIVDEMTKDLN